MSQVDAVKIAGRMVGFWARHLLAILVTVGAACVLWTVVYFVLLLWAMFLGGGIGSPAAYPIGLIFVAGAGAAIATALFLPATALAEWIAKGRKLSVLA